MVRNVGPVLCEGLMRGERPTLLLFTEEWNSTPLNASLADEIRTALRASTWPTKEVSNREKVVQRDKDERYSRAEDYRRRDDRLLPRFLRLAAMRFMFSANCAFLPSLPPRLISRFSCFTDFEP